MPPRDKLKAIKKRRDYFEGTVKVTGEHVLLVDITLNNQEVVDHVWISERAMIRAGLQKGQRIRFLATVLPYKKGYAQDAIQRSYTLGKVDKISVIG